jgi:hypothetical protein
MWMWPSRKVARSFLYGSKPLLVPRESEEPIRLHSVPSTICKESDTELKRLRKPGLKEKE